MRLKGILYMSHITSFPVYGGDEIRSTGLIRMLSRLGPVHAVINQKAAGHLPSPQALPNVQFAPFDYASHMKPVLRYFYTSSALTQHLQEILNQNPIELAVLDYQFYGNYIQFFKNRGIPVVYGTHNSEALLTLQESEYQEGWRSIKTRILYRLQQAHERLYFPMADGFMVVSEPDRRYYSKFVDEKRMVLIPNFLYPELYPQALEAPRKVDPKKIVMTADFTVFQNQDGVRWFLEHVWEKFRLDQQYHLLLVGLGSDQFLHSLPTLSNPSAVSATGKVPSIAEKIQDAAAAVVPLRYGSGTRLKILEGMWNKIPMISTSLGVEGIDCQDGKHLLVADTPEQFYQQFEKLKDSAIRESLTRNAHQLLMAQYSIDVAEDRFAQFLEDRVLPVEVKSE